MLSSFSSRKKKQSKKQPLNLFIFIFLTFLSLGFQSVSIKAESISYPVLQFQSINLQNLRYLITVCCLNSGLLTKQQNRQEAVKSACVLVHLSRCVLKLVHARLTTALIIESCQTKTAVIYSQLFRMIFIVVTINKPSFAWFIDCCT